MHSVLIYQAPVSIALDLCLLTPPHQTTPPSNADSTFAQPAEFGPLDMILATVPIRSLERLIPAMQDSPPPFALQFLKWKAPKPSVTHRAGRDLQLSWRLQGEALLHKACSQRRAIQLDLWAIDKWAQQWKTPTATRRRSMFIEEGNPVVWPVLQPTKKLSAIRTYFNMTADDIEQPGTTPFDANFHFSIFTFFDSIVVRFKNVFPSPWTETDCQLWFPFSLHNPKSIFETSTVQFPYFETWPSKITPHPNPIYSNKLIWDDSIETSESPSNPPSDILNYWLEI